MFGNSHYSLEVEYNDGNMRIRAVHMTNNYDDNIIVQVHDENNIEMFKIAVPPGIWERNVPGSANRKVEWIYNDPFTGEPYDTPELEVDGFSIAIIVPELPA